MLMGQLISSKGWWYQIRGKGTRSESIWYLKFSDTTEGCHTPKHFAADKGYGIPATCTVSSVHVRLIQHLSQKIRVKQIQTVQAQHSLNQLTKQVLAQIRPYITSLTGSSSNYLKFHKTHIKHGSKQKENQSLRLHSAAGSSPVAPSTPSLLWPVLIFHKSSMG